MERLTISVSDEFATELAAFMDDNQYENRSEAVRDLARLGLKQSRVDRGVAGECVATLSYVFNHHTRDLAKRLTNTHHHHQGFQVATMHVHLDSESCLEVAVLRGEANALKEFSNGVIAERGVTYGQFNFIPVTPSGDRHGEHSHAHAHPAD